MQTLNHAQSIKQYFEQGGHMPDPSLGAENKTSIWGCPGCLGSALSLSSCALKTNKQINSLAQLSKEPSLCL